MNHNDQLTRRSVLRLAAISVPLLTVPWLTGRGARAADAPFTIVVLPDTQFYVRYDGPSGRPDIFVSQTRWIVENLAAEQIVFVSHVGDLVNNGGQKSIEWERANAAMDLLHGHVPYAVVPGNHDYNRASSRSSGLSAFATHYGQARYSGMPWYGGCTANQASHYQLFAAGSWTFLHLGLELEAPDVALEWAAGVLRMHPGVPTIVSTHSYLNDTTGRPKQAQFQGNSGEQVWQKFIKRNRQIFMTLNGHFYASNGELAQTSTNDDGLPVFEMCSDYQAYPNGGNGWMRLIRFEPANNRIVVRTYSPWLDAFIDDRDSSFSVSVDFARRFGATQPIGPTLVPSPSATITPTVTAPSAPPEHHIYLPELRGAR